MKSALRFPISSRTTAAFIALGLSQGIIFAAGAGSDAAANYTSGWSTIPANNGTGFGAWSMDLQNAGNPPYVGTYLDSGSAVATGGHSWATYANGTGDNGAISITRAFTAGVSGSTSLVDQMFSVKIASAGVGNGSGGPPNSQIGISLGNAFNFSYYGTGSDNFLLSVDGGAATAASVNFANLQGGLIISVMVTGALNSPNEAYTFSVSSVSGGSPLFTQSGTFDASAYNTSDFLFLDSNTTGNSYFNDLFISGEGVPEPSTIALGAAGMATLLLLRRRR